MKNDGLAEAQSTSVTCGGTSLFFEMRKPLPSVLALEVMLRWAIFIVYLISDNGKNVSLIHFCFHEKIMSRVNSSLQSRSNSYCCHCCIFICIGSSSGSRKDIFGRIWIVIASEMKRKLLPPSSLRRITAKVSGEERGEWKGEERSDDDDAKFWYSH